MLINFSPEIGYVVMDVDDTCHDFLGRVCQTVGLDINTVDHFPVQNSPTLSDETKSAIASSVRNPEIYHDMQFYPGIEDVLKVEQLGNIKVVFAHNNFTERGAELVREQLLAAVPGLKPTAILTRVFQTSNDIMSKTLPFVPLIQVDDSPIYIRRSTARYRILPFKPWNHPCNQYNPLPSGPNIFWEPDLKAINQRVYSLVQYVLNSRRLDSAN